MNITGNTILITGGTSGIGLAFAEEFIKEGNKVIITGRRTDRLDAIKKRLPEIIIKVSDVADATQRAELATWISENHPDTNILINSKYLTLPMPRKEQNLQPGSVKTILIPTYLLTTRVFSL